MVGADLIGAQTNRIYSHTQKHTIPRRGRPVLITLRVDTQVSRIEPATSRGRAQFPGRLRNGNHELGYITARLDSARAKRDNLRTVQLLFDFGGGARARARSPPNVTSRYIVPTMTTAPRWTRTNGACGRPHAALYAGNKSTICTKTDRWPGVGGWTTHPPTNSAARLRFWSLSCANY